MNVNAALEAPPSDREHKSKLGQFMTSEAVAKFMANMLERDQSSAVHLLDAGAGQGALSCAVMGVWSKQGKDAGVDLTAFEIDPSLLPTLRNNLQGAGFASVNIEHVDYIADAATGVERTFTHAILNPPYKKIANSSTHRLQLKQAGISTTNLYSGFVGLALKSLVQGGQLVAIIPRSFCNGPYFIGFRDYIFQNAALTNIHLFESRTHAFQQDGVLQENIIIKLVKGVEQGRVTVSTSSDSNFHDLSSDDYDFSKIVKPGDADLFINIPTPGSFDQAETHDYRVSMPEIGVNISTGPVVGFRLREFLQEEMVEGTVPLIYAAHLRQGRVRWPLEDKAKPNAIRIDPETRKWLMPKGNYCVVRRFSSKEERHRIYASVVEANDFPDVELLGFDNKLNVFHRNKSGLPLDLAYGLAAYLNTDLVDQEFRLFSGHTQVNATDLRKLTYPANLADVGARMISGKKLNQNEIYEILNIKNEQR